MSNLVDLSKGAESVPILAELPVSNSLKSENFQQPFPVVVENEMASVIRVKRKLTEDPAQALLLTCKRRKCNDFKKENISSSSAIDENVFHFATTLKSENSLDKANKAKVQEAILTKKRIVKSLEKSNCHKRCISQADDSQDIISAKHRLLQNKEIVQDSSSAIPPKNKSSLQDKLDDSTEDILCNSVKMIREKLTISSPTKPKEEYVYDYYFCSKSLDWNNHDILDLRPCKSDEFSWELSDHEDMLDDEDDENEETNWRNDYPDELESDEDDERFGYDDEDDESNCSDDFTGESRISGFHISDSYFDYKDLAHHVNPEASYGSDLEDCDAYWRNNEDLH